MNDATRSAILAHARECMPRESCGLLVVIPGRDCETYWPCRNIAPDPADGIPSSDFWIHHADFARASIAGTVIAIVHSHPNSYPAPTPADLAQCELHGLPWHIVSPHLGDGNGQWFMFEPSGYRAPLIGRPWTWGVHDCWALVRDWYADHGLALKDYPRADAKAFLARPLFVDLFRDAGFGEVGRGDAAPGDAVLMSIRSPGLNHVGVLLPDGYLLHHLQGRLSSAEIYGEAMQKVTGKILRHVNSSQLVL